MRRKALPVTVNPDVMKWARESTGLDTTAVARRLSASVDTVEQWESHEPGAKKPTVKTLEELASFYKRPLSAFLLPEPPQEPPMPTDLRTVPEREKHPLSRKTRLAIRRARRLQSLATELMEAAGRQPVALIGKAVLTEDPEVVASVERDRLQISVNDQFSWRDHYVAFRKWREAVESRNIMVLQAQIRVEEARGFTLLDSLLPTIVISARDFIGSRTFTLFHEYAHFLLGTSGICIPNEALYENGDGHEIERFCDHFAGAFLVPKHALRSKAESATHMAKVDDSYLDEIAGLFKVSRPVILRRMLICELISKPQYERKLAEIQYQRKRHDGGFGVPAAKRCILENGSLFISLVLDAKNRELINYSNLADYLSINLKHLGKLEALLHRQK
jgi:Zn-dependent peptidase ImmA (M78 family)